METIKVGDIVYLKKNLKYGEMYGGVHFHKCMKTRKPLEVLEVGCVDYRCTADKTNDPSGWWYSEEMLLTDKPKVKKAIKKKQKSTTYIATFEGRLVSFEGRLVSKKLCWVLFNRRSSGTTRSMYYSTKSNAKRSLLNYLKKNNITNYEIK